MDAAQTIRDSVAEVFHHRAEVVKNPELGAAVAAVKLLQTRRFALTYADLLSGGPYQGAATFFLQELYGDKDYSNRDQQFSRIAGALQKLLPKQALATAVLLAKLHLMTEELDQAMGLAWLGLKISETDFDVESGSPDLGKNLGYVNAWRAVGRKNDRHQQLQNVIEMGRDLSRLTKMPGLRLMLKMMRRPAEAAGLGDLQHFLESGFDTFANIAKSKDGVTGFLSLIEQRELKLIDGLFDVPPVEMATRLMKSD